MQCASDQNLEESMHEIFVQAEAMLSVTSISSTATASDLPGAGRLLGNMYSLLGKRLEGILNRIAERRGRGPWAIEERVLRLCLEVKNDMLGHPVVHPGTKNEQLLRKDLERLVAYTRSNITSNREAAFTVIATIAIANPQFSFILRDLGAIQALGLACVREEDYIYTGHLLSPSRKALICVLESNINKTGYEWMSTRTRSTGLSLGLASFIKLGKAHMIELYTKRLNKYKILVAFAGSKSPEESFLAATHLGNFQKGRASYIRRFPDAEVQNLGHRFSHINCFLARIIQQKAMEEPNCIDWPSLALLIGYLQHALLCTPGSTNELISFVHQLIDNILVLSHNKIPAHVQADIIVNNARLAQLL